MEPLLRTKALTKKFYQVVAIDSVSFDVRPGEIHCLLGENGAGMSLFLYKAFFSGSANKLPTVLIFEVVEKQAELGLEIAR